ncbi:MAG: hypothetical protein WDN45_15905 [Caulobacteraceae bacterium]
MNLPIGAAGLVLVYCTCRTTARRTPSARRRRPDPVQFRHRPVVLCAGDIRRPHAGRHRDPRTPGPVPAADHRVRAARGAHRLPPAATGPVPHPHLQLRGQRQLLHTPGHRGRAFLLPLLYQVGLGFTPVQSGLLIMPQALAALSTKFLLPKILDRVGYRNVLISTRWPSAVC